MTERQKLERSYRRVFGRPGQRNADQERVYNHLMQTALKTCVSKDLSGKVDPHGTVGLAHAQEQIFNIIRLADKSPEEEKQPKVKTEDDDGTNEEDSD